MNDKIWHWIGDYCSGLLDKSEERELRAWMDEAEENKQLFMEGVKMVREYQMIARSSKGALDSLKRVQENSGSQKKAIMDSSCCSSFCCDLVRFIICILFILRNQKRCLPCWRRYMPEERKRL
ncbi:MAG: hypothetical protein ACLUDU_08450 [Butyricimonas faecihominis]